MISHRTPSRTLRGIVVTSRCILTAALVFTLCAGTSCERRSSGKITVIANPAIAAFTSEGDAAREQGRYADALAAYQKALALRDKAGDPKSWCVTATSVALMHMKLAAWKDAEPLLTEILRLREKHCGPQVPETAKSLGNLAQLLKDTNRLAEAEPLMRRALAIDEASELLMSVEME